MRKKRKLNKEKELELEIVRYIEERKNEEMLELSRSESRKKYRETAMSAPGEVRIFLDEKSEPERDNGYGVPF